MRRRRRRRRKKTREKEKKRKEKEKEKKEKRKKKEERKKSKVDGAVIARERVDTRARARERARRGARTCVRACPCGVLALRSFTVLTHARTHARTYARTHACMHAAGARPRNARACLEAGTRGLLRLRHLLVPSTLLLRLKITGDSRNSACIDQRSPLAHENLIEFYCHDLGATIIVSENLSRGEIVWDNDRVANGFRGF